MSYTVVFDEFPEKPGIFCPVDKERLIKVEIQDRFFSYPGVKQRLYELVDKRRLSGSSCTDEQQDLFCPQV